MVEESYKLWITDKNISLSDKRKIKKMSKSKKEESFYKNLEFGTAGIRGIMGLGSAKINKYTISKITKGLANFLNKKYKNPSVVIAYDTRHNSKDYALLSALILNKNNIKTYIFDEYTSTPELAFAVKYLKCDAGIVITSSHNSKKYNGYKVYNKLGSQVVYPDDEEIKNEINKINSFDIEKERINNSLYNIVPKIEKKEFLKENKKCLINESLLQKYGKTLNLTYSSLHGVGLKPFLALLKDYNINCSIVKKQSKYDGNFPYAKEPNPEYLFNYDLAIKNAKKNKSDIIILTDPDADRVGIMIKDKLGYRLLSGNLVGCIFTYYIVTNSLLKKDNYIVKSIPTSNMIDAICDKYNIKLKEVLTGCKNIAYEKQKNEKDYLFGFEESLGYMFNIDIYDKNGFSSSLFILEILSYCKNKKISLGAYINKMYKDIGYYYDSSFSLEFDGVDGMNRMNKIMENFRNNVITLPKYKKKIDYLEKTNDLKTNALKYFFDDDTFLVIRPSGTEPKIKLYFESFDKNSSISLDKLEILKNNILNQLK